jgi:UDP-MurNAc hydroxylase
MRATLVGHATWLFETAAGNLLSDPVLSDPFEQGTVTSCPARAVDLAQLPPLVGLFISHRHLDHFHVDSLRLLPRDVPVYCPADLLLQAALRRLGFEHIVELHAFEPVVLNGPSGRTELWPVPSVSDDFIEVGLCIVDQPTDGPRVVLYNQVDTPLTNATIQRLLRDVGRPDVHLAMYASQDFGWFQGRSEDLATTYSRNLQAAISLGASAVVPAAAGFRFVDAHSFLNALLFPISEQRYAQELAQLAPGIHVERLLPGDTIVVRPGGLDREKGNSAFARTLDADDWRLSYNPTGPVPAVTDRNESGYPLAHLRGFVDMVLDAGMAGYLNGALAIGEDVATRYRNAEATYRVEVVFPDGDQVWSWTFRTDGTWSRFRGSDAPAADVFWRVAASGLVDLCEGRRSCFAVRPDARKWSRAFRARSVAAAVLTEPLELPDLLTHLILNLRVRMKGEEEAMLAYYGLV